MKKWTFTCAEIEILWYKMTNFCTNSCFFSPCHANGHNWHAQTDPLGCAMVDKSLILSNFQKLKNLIKFFYCNDPDEKPEPFWLGAIHKWCQIFLAYFLTYLNTPVRFFPSINFQFYYMVSDFGNTTYLPQNRTSFMDVLIILLVYSGMKNQIR